MENETQLQDNAFVPPAQPHPFTPPEPQVQTTQFTPAPSETFTVSRTTFNYVVIAAVFLFVGVITGALLFNRGSGAGLSGVDRAELMRIVQDAVAQASESGLSNIELADDDPSLGPDDAPVTMVEFSDFNCQYCTRYATQTLQSLIEHYGDNLRIVYRDYPVIGGELSVVAAQAGNCAREQGKFWEFHRLLFSNSAARDRDAYVGFAQELGLDADEFGRCFDSGRFAAEVNLDFIDGQSLGIRGTPGFFINGKYLSGALPFDYFAAMIDRELERVGITPPPRPVSSEATSAPS